MPNTYHSANEALKEHVGFDLKSSLLYGLVFTSLLLPLLLEFVFLPLFYLAFSIDNFIGRSLFGGALILSTFFLAPCVHYVEARLFQLEGRFEPLGGISLATSLRAPLYNYGAAIGLWLCIEVAVHQSSGVYNTPNLINILIFMTVTQVSNLIVTDLVFWIIHGPWGLHNPVVFKHIHSKHHRQRVATFSTGPDLSPFDMFAEVSLLLVVPIVCGFMLGFNSLEFVFCSLANTMMTTTWAHSPYRTEKIAPQASVLQYILVCFPYLAENPHQVHHAKIQCNYSTWGLWDRLLGTYESASNKDELSACKTHLSNLKRTSTTSWLFPKYSIAPYIELGGSCLVIIFIWILAINLGFKPEMIVESSLFIK